jgi:hypothetical protein
MHHLLLRRQLHHQLLLNMTQVPVLTLKLAKPGVELVLSALVKMPYEESAGLIREIEAQANFQLEMMRKAAEATQASAATNPSPEAEQAPSAPADPVPTTIQEGN